MTSSDTTSPSSNALAPGCETLLETVTLCAVEMFARDARTLLLQNPARTLAIGQFEHAYSQYFGVNLAPASYGYPSLTALIQAVPLVLSLRGKTQQRRFVVLNSTFHGSIKICNLFLLNFNLI